MKTIVYREDKASIAKLGDMGQFKVAAWTKKGSGKWERWEPLAWHVQTRKRIKPMPEELALEIREKRASAGRKAYINGKRRKIAAIADINERLNAPSDANVGKWLLDGEISQEEAMRIAEKCRHRHEDTDYEDLLAQGFDKEEARSMMSPKSKAAVEKHHKKMTELGGSL